MRIYCPDGLPRNLISNPGNGDFNLSPAFYALEPRSAELSAGGDFITVLGNGFGPGDSVNLRNKATNQDLCLSTEGLVYGQFYCKTGQGEIDPSTEFELIVDGSAYDCQNPTNPGQCFISAEREESPRVFSYTQTTQDAVEVTGEDFERASVFGRTVYAELGANGENRSDSAVVVDDSTIELVWYNGFPGNTGFLKLVFQDQDEESPNTKQAWIDGQ